MTENALTVFGSYNAEDDFAQMRQQDKILPRLRLGADMSQPVKDRLVNSGDWFNSAANETVFAKGVIGKIIPLISWLEWIEWNPDKAAPNGTGPGKKILARTTDYPSELASSAERFEKVMTLKGEKLKVTEYYNFLVLVPEYFGNYKDMMLLNFSRTGHKIGKQWLNRMRNFRLDDGAGGKLQAPMPAVCWELSQTQDKNDAGETYWVPTIGKGTILPNEVIAATLQAAQRCKDEREKYKAANATTDDGETTTNTPINPDL